MVATAWPVGSPSGRRSVRIWRHSARIAGPPALWIAPSTPPPPSSPLLAALTIASAGKAVMSPWMRRTVMGASVPEAPSRSLPEWPRRWDSLTAHDNHSPNPGEAGANPALSRNREPGPPQGPSKSEHLADWGSHTVRGRRWSPDRAVRPPDPPSPWALLKGTW